MAEQGEGGTSPLGRDVLDVLVRAAELRTTRRPLREVLLDVCRMAREITGAQYAALGVLGRNDDLEEFIHVGMDEERAERIGELPRGRGVLGLLIRHPEPLRLERLAEHPAAVGVPEHHPSMEAFLGVPVVAGGKAFGNLYLAEKPGGFDGMDEALVQVLAAQAGAAIESGRLLDRLSTVAVRDERERIGRDLHDRTVQSLFALGMTLEATLATLDADPDTARERIDHAVDRIDEIIAEVRGTILELESEDLETVRDRLVAGARLHEQATGVRPRLLLTPNLDESLAPGVADDLVSIVGEALSNIARHAKATDVSVSVEVFDDQVVVAVQDDGVGFDPSSVNAGRGLNNLRARAARHHGSATFDSGPGGGTTLVVHLPIDSGARR